MEIFFRDAGGRAHRSRLFFQDNVKFEVSQLLDFSSLTFLFFYKAHELSLCHKLGFFNSFDFGKETMRSVKDQIFKFERSKDYTIRLQRNRDWKV